MLPWRDSSAMPAEMTVGALIIPGKASRSPEPGADVPVRPESAVRSWGADAEVSSGR
jgi:hypothetical protein